MAKKKAKKSASVNSTIIPSKIEIDAGPRTMGFAEKVYPQFLKAWWFIAIIFLVIVLAGFGLFLFFANKFFSFF